MTTIADVAKIKHDDEEYPNVWELARKVESLKRDLTEKECLIRKLLRI